MFLVYRDGAGNTCSLSLAGRARVTIGREAARDLFLDDARVSRLHATIEAIEGTFLLRDAGSANGTFLNGLRVSGTNAFVLRHGDVIEVGSARLLLGAEPQDEPDETPHGTLSLEEGIETGHPLADLLRDGGTLLRDPSRERLLRALAGVPDPERLGEALALAQGHLDVDALAVFLGGERDETRRCAAARPGEAAARLGAIAARSSERREGRIFQTRLPAEPVSLESTMVEAPARSFAAAPFLDLGSRRVRGVLVVERLARRLDRKDLALVATFGEWMGRSLARTGGKR